MTNRTEEIRAFNLRTRQACTVKEPEIVVMKNGRKAVRGIASDDGKTKVFRILSADEASRLGAGGLAANHEPRGVSAERLPLQ
jgi:hypothetical protein